MPILVQVGFYDQWLYYTVRFQNTGNAMATDVTIRDPLSAHIDCPTLTPMAWSFTPEVSVEPDGDAVFRFKNIMLPDSGSDLAASQGIIRYKVKAKGNQFPGTETENTVHIFFDFNPPIITNTTLKTMECYKPEGLVNSYIETELRSPFKHPVGQQWYLNDALTRSHRADPYPRGQRRLSGSCRSRDHPFLPAPKWVLYGVYGTGIRCEASSESS